MNTKKPPKEGLYRYPWGHFAFLNGYYWSVNFAAAQQDLEDMYEHYVAAGIADLIAPIPRLATPNPPRILPREELEGKGYVSAKQFLTRRLREDYHYRPTQKEIWVFAGMAKRTYRKTVQENPPESDARNLTGGGRVWYCPPQHLEVFENTYGRFLQETITGQTLVSRLEAA
ncbi:hypothetical protein [Bifidobacterium cuniculi]|uniref:Uncharacterized protein n=1 Tax=Bifidobacterium cuniculi TaxID=1688 RepID=A0A087B4Y9_9BIFI|nr:hypothetical protein [Bifidobacterium cuniculi]KFI66089.1 hypothetical protein BCUN_0591 [Bifidobacterium cuniculi]